MKRQKTILFLGICLSATLGFTGCSDDDENKSEVHYMLPQTQKVHLTYKERVIVEANQEFTFNLLREAYKQQQAGANRDMSFCISPVGATAMLGMVASGATGETQSEIMKTLGFSSATIKAMNELCHKLIEEGPETDKQVKLEMAHAIYTNMSKAGMNEAFRADMEKYYNADACALNFSDDTSLTSINNEIKDETDGAFATMMETLDANASAYLLNANFCKPTWTNQFNKVDTKTETFTKNDGTTAQVQMMHNKAIIQAYTSPKINSTMLCLPYGSGSAWNMYIITPGASTDLDNMVEHMNKDTWSDFFKYTFVGEFELGVPKFTTSSFMDMKNVLGRIGVEKACTPEAELSGISSNEGLYISHAMQKNYIAVDEETAKTVPVAAVEVKDLEITPDVVGEVKTFNESFIYLICESSTNTIFLAGVYQGD